MNNIYFEECSEKEATHVEILKDDKERYKEYDITIGNIYEINWFGGDGEEYIEDDNGRVVICSFSLFLNVKYLKVNE